MNPRQHRRRAAVGALFAASLLGLTGARSEAATLRWTGLAATPNWSEAGNWDALAVPANGDALLFAGAATQSVSVFDLTRSFASLSYAADAQAYTLHVQGSGATLTFDGAGIVNGTAGSGPFSRDIVADAGSGGSSIVFSGHAGINVSGSGDLRPVNLIAAGGAAATALGGRLVFQDQSATGTNTYDGLRAEGASAAGASGGSIVFRDDALATRSSSIAVFGGTVLGALGAQASFEARSRVEGALTVFAGSAGGQGARATFSGTAVAAASTGISIAGGESATTGAEGRARFEGDARMAGSATTNPGTGAGFSGGRLEFAGRATHDSSANDPSLGFAQIDNYGAGTAGARGGATVFMDDAAVVGSRLIISNFVAGESGVAGTAGGTTSFQDRSRAGQVTLVNQGALVAGAGTLGGATFFSGQASADQAVIFNRGGQAASAFGGFTQFSGTATAGAAALVVEGSGVDQAFGGTVVFFGGSSAGTATLNVQAAGVLGATGGRAVFFDSASAGAALVTIGGSVVDHVLGSEGATVTFANASSAGGGRFFVGGNAYAGGGVGTLRFADLATADNASITLAAGQTRGGALNFEGAGVADLASAGRARITNQGWSAGAPRGLAIGGQTSFAAHSSAANAAITNEAGTGAGLTRFLADATAGDAAITNRGGAAGEDGGTTQFNNTATAGRAAIVNRAGARGSSGFDAMGVTRFLDQASAGQARITADGATSAGAVGGLISFGGTADPASATLVAEGGTNGGGGGRVLFAGLTNASLARVVVNAGDRPAGAGELDISGLSVGGVAVGAIEGGGMVSLGSKNLTVWSPTAATIFSGLLRDGGVAGGAGGSLSVTGGARLTLTGANLYSGGTRIGDGVNAGSGKLVAANAIGSATGSGEVVVRRGGTLGGSGSIAGPVTLMDGGLIAPGDPVTLTLDGGLTWDGGGVVRLALGADAAGSDHLVAHSLTRGAGSGFVFELVDFGYVAGATYDLLQYDSLMGFTAADFTFSGLAGTFEMLDGHLAFTTSAVPEPGAVWLGLLGGLMLGAVLRRRAVQLR
jgi:fibronectin-binding autotransporter adhesin